MSKQSTERREKRERGETEQTVKRHTLQGISGDGLWFGVECDVR